MTKSAGLTNQHKGIELKRKLLGVVEESNKKLSTAIQALLDKSHRSEEDTVALLRSIVTIVDGILSEET